MKGWKQLGFLAGGDGITFCKLEDEKDTMLPIFHGDSDSEDD